jgi:hypothetical protein
VIFWRRSSDWVALLVSFSLVFVGAFLMGPTEDGITRHHAAWIPIKDAALLAGIVALVLVLFVFPDGRFVPRWTRFVPIAAGAGFLPLSLPLPEAVFAIAGTVTALGILATGVYAGIYRYRRVSTPVQRQQTKWIAFGLAGIFASIVLWFVTFLAFPVDQPRPSRIYFLLIYAPTVVVIGFVLPMSVAIAMLRHRLWDVDIILNRTMVYGPLSGILLGLYIASIRLFQTLFVQFTGQESDISILLSTLVLAGAFMPLRLRLEALAQRYFKEGSDPASGLSVFATQVRSVAELADVGRMTRRLLDETVAAFHAESGAVFLRQGEALRLVQTAGAWKDDAVIDVPIEHQGVQIGQISLGARHRSREYSPKDREALQDIANATAQVLAVASGHHH